MMMRFFAAMTLGFLLLVGTTGSASAQSASSSTPDTFNFKAGSLYNLEIMGKRLLIIAQGIPPDKYTWNPGLNGRSVAELFMHVAFLNFVRPGQMGAPPPSGFSQENYEKSTTDKTKVIEQLTQALNYSEKSVRNLSDADLRKPAKVNGHDSTVDVFLAAWLSDMSEYVGQAIVYGRLNGVTPPTPASVAPKAQTGQ